MDKSKYVVLDVETNGLNLMYDLLSISFYMPDSGKTFERFLPLEKNIIVYPEASKVNGITKEMLKDKKPLTQEEWDKIVEDFELKTREILHFGKIDPSFLKDYFKNHKIKGFNDLVFHNIKRHFLTNSFSHGEYSKDNLCLGLGIEGVSEVHSGVNDCILEWKLFEKIDGGFVICERLGGYKMGMYKLNEKYYMPASKIRYYPNVKYAINLPDLRVEYEEVFSLNLSKKCLHRLDGFFQPAGFASERIIRSALNAKVIEDSSFAKENFKNLQLIGEFTYDPMIHEIPVIENSDGTLTAVRPSDKLFVAEMNRTMLAIKDEIKPLIKFITDEVFLCKEINSQETVINDDLRIFGYTDFSNDSTCLEMKFSGSLMDDYLMTNNRPALNKHKYQFFALAKDRPMYLLIGAYTKFVVLKLSFFVGEESKRERIINRVYKKKAVIQYDLRGKKIKEYDSVFDAANAIGKSYRTVRDCCQGRSQLCGGYQFKYKGSDKEIGEVVIEKRHNNGGNRAPRKTKHVLQYSKSMEFIKEFESMKQAELETGAESAKISMVCNGKRKSAGGYIWKFKEEDSSII